MALYRCGGAGGLTPLTPSNSSPVAISSGGKYEATAAGYAIESYSSVTPSNSSPAAVTSGDICKMGGSGYAIESYSTLSPNNSSPGAITTGQIYKSTGPGVAIAEITSVTITTAGVPLDTQHIYKFTNSGAASIGRVYPSSVYGAILRNASEGYTYDSSYAYLITAVTRVNGTNSTASAWSYVNGTLRELESSASADIEVSNGRFILKGQSTYYTEFSVFRLTIPN